MPHSHPSSLQAVPGPRTRTKAVVRPRPSGVLLYVLLSSGKSATRIREALAEWSFVFKEIGDLGELESISEPGCVLLDIPIKEAMWLGELPALTARKWAIIFGPTAESSAQEMVWSLRASYSAGAGVVEVAETLRNLPRRLLAACQIQVSRLKLERDTARAIGAAGFPAALPTAIDRPPQDGLDSVLLIRWAAECLRNETSGRLDAKKVAELFDLSLAELAPFVGVTAQAISQTPDSQTIQEKLGSFERVARLLHRFNGNQGLFSKWLNTPVLDFGEKAPLQVIKAGQLQAVVDYVADLLEYRAPHD